jgi:hypothetical protein
MLSQIAPPGTSDEHITVSQMLKGDLIDGAVVVTTPQVCIFMPYVSFPCLSRLHLIMYHVVHWRLGSIIMCCSKRTQLL